MTNNTLALLAADPSRIECVARAELPALIGEAARLHALLQAQLLTAPIIEKPVTSTNGPGALLTVAQTAERLAVSSRWSTGTPMSCRSRNG